MVKLYELTDQFQELQDRLDECLDEDTRELLLDTIESLEGEIEHKLEYLVRIQKGYEAEEAMFKAEKDKLAEKQRTAGNKAESLKRFIEEQLLHLGYDGDNKKQMQAGLWKLAIQKNNPKLEISPDAKIPAEFYVIPEPMLNRAELTRKVKDGLTVEGVELVRTQSIRIR